MNRRKTGIVGGGASGLMAAVAAAERGGEEIFVLEKKERIGKKILATGNGRCNLTNLSFEMDRLEEYYHGASARQLRTLFSCFSPKDTLSLFRKMGMLTVSREGYVYPLSGQASTVLDTLRFRLERKGVWTRTECGISGIEPLKRGGFLVSCGDEKQRFDRLILACGSPAGLKNGDGMDGYRLAASLGHTVIPPQPALTALRCDGNFWKGLAGVRCNASVRLFVGKASGSGGLSEYEEEGELQLTDYGISGIPVFQLSRHASRALAEGKRVSARIDFLPAFTGSKEEYGRFVKERIDAFCRCPMEMLFCGLVNKKIILTLLKQNDLRLQDAVEQKNEQAILRVFGQLRAFSVRVKEANPFPLAQVCSGGVPLCEVTERMESRKHPGLYFAGELLDVDGRCGGYNLQWAWTSGYLAGRGQEGPA